ncbi:MAG: rod shape-determining protein RodA [Chloroflexi bacterium]|nr:rod shape-determining protein RodA [Chloroflexota bacterium]
MTAILQTHRRQIWQHFDVSLLALVSLLVIVGIAMIRSTTFESPELANYPFVQIRWALVGLVILFGAAIFDYRYLRSLARPMYVFVLIWLFTVAAAGIASFGAQRWVRLGTLNIQPSEMAKIGTVIWMADFATRNREKLKNYKWVLASLAFAGMPAAFVLAEPNLSTAIMIMIVWFAIMFAAGLKWEYMAALGVLAAIGAFVVLLVAFQVVTIPNFPLEDYQRLRIVRFIFPNADPDAQYNVLQALISIGSGGLFGEGYNHASQVNLRFLKVRHTDFIFASLSAEFGFVGAALLMITIALIIIRILRVARAATDPFGALICYGVAVLVFYQSFFNIGMNMNLLPVTGLPLPFVSYGGSALVTYMFAIGLVESVALRHKELER